MKTYSEMILLPTFEERLEYLRQEVIPGDVKFGLMRYLNQKFYTSCEWYSARNKAIVRDNGCDLGIPGRLIIGNIYVHHIEEVTLEMLESGSPLLVDLDNLISTSKNTHDAITFGTPLIKKEELIIRRPNDTCPWR